MEKKNPISEMLQESMAKVREMVDTNTIIGEPIETPDGVTLIPVSRVSIGFGGGGTAFTFGNKKEIATPPDPNLGAGIGAGVKIDPVAFLIVKDGAARVMPVAAPPLNTVDRVIEMVPNVVDQVNGFIEKNIKKKGESDNTENQKDAATGEADPI